MRRRMLAGCQNENHPAAGRRDWGTGRVSTATEATRFELLLLDVACGKCATDEDS
jgi:hypothetical protein